MSVYWGARIFQKSTSNSRRQKYDMKQVPYWGSSNIRSGVTKFSRPGEMAPGIFAPMPMYLTSLNTLVLEKLTVAQIAKIHWNWNVRCRVHKIQPQFPVLSQRDPTAGLL